MAVLFFNSDSKRGFNGSRLLSDPDLVEGSAPDSVEGSAPDSINL